MYAAAVSAPGTARIHASVTIRGADLAGCRAEGWPAIDGSASSKHQASAATAVIFKNGFR